eukprot:464530-Rhodomonas_salina.1
MHVSSHIVGLVACKALHANLCDAMQVAHVLGVAHYCARASRIDEVGVNGSVGNSESLQRNDSRIEDPKMSQC